MEKLEGYAAAAEDGDAVGAGGEETRNSELGTRNSELGKMRK